MGEKSYNQRIKKALAAGKDVSEIERERDLAYINEMHGFAAEIIRALDKRRYQAAVLAMRAMSRQLLARAQALGDQEIE